MFCSKCGKEIPAGTAFCSGCGTAVGYVQHTQMNESQAFYSNGIEMGFSSKVNDPSLQSTLKKNGKGTLIFAVILILLPIIVTFFIGVSEDNFSALPIGLAISVVMLVFNLVSLAKKKAVKQWDGLVIDKQCCGKQDHDSEDRGRKTYTEYTVVLQDDCGKTRKITEGNPTNSAHPYYEYLNIGDRVRYHPQFNNFYEKYDKTHDTYLYCAICGKTNDIAEEYCTHCNSLLVK